jgi:gas vesicle protein
MRKFGNLMLGALLGGLVGGTVALLFAPASGKQTRENIQGYFNNLKEEVNKAADEKRKELENQLKELRSGESAKHEG